MSISIERSPVVLDASSNLDPTEVVAFKSSLHEMVDMGLFYLPTLAADSVVNELLKVLAVDLVWLVPLTLLSLWFSTRDGKAESIFIFVTIVVSIVVAYIFGLFYSHPAPYMESAHTLLSGAPENSFPSQHTAVVFGMAWPLVWLRRWRTGFLALVLAVVVGVSRVAVGLHFPIDIAGGVVASLVGFGLVYAARTSVRAVAGRCIRLEDRFWAVVQSE